MSLPNKFGCDMTTSKKHFSLPLNSQLDFDAKLEVESHALRHEGFQPEAVLRILVVILRDPRAFTRILGTEELQRTHIEIRKDVVQFQVKTRLAEETLLANDVKIHADVRPEHVSKFVQVTKHAGSVNNG